MPKEGPIVPNWMETIGECIEFDIAIFNDFHDISNLPVPVLCFPRFNSYLLCKFVHDVALMYDCIAVYLGPHKDMRVCVLKKSSLKPEIQNNFDKYFTVFPNAEEPVTLFHLTRKLAANILPIPGVRRGARKKGLIVKDPLQDAYSQQCWDTRYDWPMLSKLLLKQPSSAINALNFHSFLNNFSNTNNSNYLFTTAQPTINNITMSNQYVQYDRAHKLDSFGCISKCGQPLLFDPDITSVVMDKNSQDHIPFSRNNFDIHSGKNLQFQYGASVRWPNSDYKLYSFPDVPVNVGSDVKGPRSSHYNLYASAKTYCQFGAPVHAQEERNANSAMNIFSTPLAKIGNMCQRDGNNMSSGMFFNEINTATMCGNNIYQTYPGPQPSIPIQRAIINDQRFEECHKSLGPIGPHASTYGQSSIDTPKYAVIPQIHRSSDASYSLTNVKMSENVHYQTNEKRYQLAGPTGTFDKTITPSAMQEVPFQNVRSIQELMSYTMHQESDYQASSIDENTITDDQGNYMNLEFALNMPMRPQIHPSEAPNIDAMHTKLIPMLTGKATMVCSAFNYTSLTTNFIEITSHIIELSGIPDFFLPDHLLSIYQEGPRYLVWCDTTHALLVTSSAEHAERALKIQSGYVHSRPSFEASHISIIAMCSQKLGPATSMTNDLPDMKKVMVNSTLDLGLPCTLSGIRNMLVPTVIDRLILRNCKIEQIECLDDCVNLRLLDLSHNNIKHIEGLKYNNSLDTLKLSNNQIEKINNLHWLLNLSTLDLGGNRIKKIENLENLLHLEVLVLKRNCICVIENLDFLRYLKVLNLSGNFLAVGNNLNANTNLQYLDLTLNPLMMKETLDNLSGLIMKGKLEVQVNSVTV